MSTTSFILFTHPWLLFPRRIEIYLKEKGLINTECLIRVPIEFSDKGSYASPPGSPPMPEHVRTIPALCVKTPGKPDRYVYESTAIIEYLEEALPGKRELRGSTPEQRGRVRDMTSLANNINHWIGVWMYNERELPKGRMGHGQIAATAAWGREKTHELLSRVEQWMERYAVEDGEQGGGKTWLVGTKEPTVADCMLLATVQFSGHLYGVGLLEGHPQLQKWMALWEGRESAILEAIPSEEMASMGRANVH